MTLEELVLEWSYRTQRGYPKLDNPSDLHILKNLLIELELPTDILDELDDETSENPTYANKDGKPGIAGMEPGLDGEDPQDTEKTDDDLLDPETEKDAQTDTEEPSTTGDVTLDEVIQYHLEKNNLWKGSIPKPKGNYEFNGQYGGTFDEKVTDSDMEIYQLLYPVTPPKKGQALGTAETKGMGNGEVALYWLYQHSGVAKVKATHGSDNPDLEFNGVGCEVKAYESYTGKHGLGRFGQDTKELKLLGMIFGINALLTAFKPKEEGQRWAPKDVNPLSWQGQDLLDAFYVVDRFRKQLDATTLAALADNYDVFQDIQENLQWLDENLEGGWKTPEEGARKMAVAFVKPKFKRKPADGGYVINLMENGEIRFWNIDFKRIVELDEPIQYIGTSQGSMNIDYQGVFGNN